MKTKMIKKMFLNSCNTLVYKLKSVNLRHKGNILCIPKLYQEFFLTKKTKPNLSILTLYQEYLSLRRNSKMKVIARFKEDGLPIQKVIETLLYECCLKSN